MTTTSVPPTDITQTPLWRVRLRLMAKSFRANWRLFVQNRVGVIGLGMIVFFGLFAAVHPILMATVWAEQQAIYDPVSGHDLGIPVHPAPPSAEHWLGTDARGTDVMSQLMYSTRFEFGLGILSAVVTMVISTSLGAVAAFFGGIIDTLIMRLVDLVIMIPALAILIVLSALAEVGIVELALFIGLLSGFGGTTIVVKSQALTIKVKPFIEAARVAGGSDFHIIFRHMVPNLLPISLLYMMFTVTAAIFSEAVLSFFGLTEIEMSWGIMINLTSNFGYLLRFDTWWLLFPPSVAITLLSAAFYLVGRALDEVVNPRLRQR